MGCRASSAPFRSPCADRIHVEMEAFVSESRAQLSDAKAADRVAARVPAYRAREASRANRAYPVVTPAHQI